MLEQTTRVKFVALYLSFQIFLRKTQHTKQFEGWNLIKARKIRSDTDHERLHNKKHIASGTKVPRWQWEEECAWALPKTKRRERDSVSVEFLYIYCYIHSGQFAQLSSEETHHWHRHQPSTHAMELIGNEKWVHAVNGINLRSKTVDGEENVVHEYAKSEDLIEVLRRVYEFIVSAASPNVFTICLRFSFFFRVSFIRWS